MQKRLLAGVVATALCGASVSAAAADSWHFLPIKDPSYKADATVSLLFGFVDPNNVSADIAPGIEAAFNCLLVAPPTGIIRTKLSYLDFDHSGVRLQSYELNPRWTVPVGSATTAGVGPGLGIVHAASGGRSGNLFAVQVGADINHRIGSLDLGAAARWQQTQGSSVISGGSSASNFLIEAKVGFVF